MKWNKFGILGKSMKSLVGKGDTENADEKNNFAALTIQRCVRAKFARNNLRLEQGRLRAAKTLAKAKNGESVPEFIELIDHMLQIPYYYCRSEDSIVWSAPEEFEACDPVRAEKEDSKIELENKEDSSADAAASSEDNVEVESKENIVEVECRQEISAAESNKDTIANNNEVTPRELNSTQTSSQFGETVTPRQLDNSDDDEPSHLNDEYETGSIGDLETFQAPLSSPTRLSHRNQENNSTWNDVEGDFFTEDFEDVPLFHGMNNASASSARTRDSLVSRNTLGSENSQSLESEESQDSENDASEKDLDSLASLNSTALQQEIQKAGLGRMSHTSASQMGDKVGDVEQDFPVSEVAAQESVPILVPDTFVPDTANEPNIVYNEFQGNTSNEISMPHHIAHHPTETTQSNLCPTNQNAAIVSGPSPRVLVEFCDSRAGITSIIVNLDGLHSLHELQEECQSRMGLEKIDYFELKNYKARVEQLADLRNDDVIVATGDRPDPATDALRGGTSRSISEPSETGSQNKVVSGTGEQLEEKNSEPDKTNNDDEDDQSNFTIEMPQSYPLPNYVIYKLEKLLVQHIHSIFAASGSMHETKQHKSETEPRSQLEAQREKCFDPVEALPLLATLMPDEETLGESCNPAACISISMYLHILKRIGAKMPIAQQRMLFDVMDREDNGEIDPRTLQLFLHKWQVLFLELRERQSIHTTPQFSTGKGDFALAPDLKVGRSHAFIRHDRVAIERAAVRVQNPENAPFCSATSTASHSLFRKRQPKRTMERLLRARVLANRFSEEFRKSHKRGTNRDTKAQPWELSELDSRHQPEGIPKSSFWVSPKLTYYQKEEKLRRALVGARGHEKAEILYCFADCLMEEAKRRQRVSSEGKSNDEFGGFDESFKSLSGTDNSANSDDAMDSETNRFEAKCLVRRAQNLLEQALREVHVTLQGCFSDHEGSAINHLEKCKAVASLQRLKAQVAAMLGKVHSELGAPEKVSVTTMAGTALNANEIKRSTQAQKYFEQSLAVEEDSKSAAVFYTRAEHHLKLLAELRNAVGKENRLESILRQIDQSNCSCASEVIVQLEMEATNNLLSAISLEPDHIPSLLALGRLLQVSGDLPNSETYLRRATGIHNWASLTNRPSSSDGTTRSSNSPTVKPSTTTVVVNPVNKMLCSSRAFVRERAEAMKVLAILVSDTRQEHDLSVALLKKSCRLVPRQVDAMFHLGRLLCVHKREFEVAEKWFRKVVECDPDHDDALLALAQLLAQEDVVNVRNKSAHLPKHTSRILEAEKLYKRVIEILSCSVPAEGKVDAACRLLALGKLQKALHSFAQFWEVVHQNHEQACHYFELAHHMNPESTAATCAFGNFLRDKGDHTKAMPLLKRVAQKDPKDVESRFALAQSLLAQGQEIRAVEYLNEVVKLSPCHGEALWALAKLERTSGNWERAESLYERVSGCAVNFPADVLADYGDFLYELGSSGCGDKVVNHIHHHANAEAAVARLKAALRIDPNHAQALGSLGWITYEAGEDIHGAVGLLRRAVKRDASNSKLLVRLGTLLSLAAVKGPRYVPGAVGFLVEDDALVDGHRMYGNVSEQEVMNLDEAALLLDQALLLQPDDVEGLLKGALVLAATVAREEAVATYTSPWGNTNSQRRNELGSTLSRLKKATRFLRRAIKISPKDAELHFHLGTILQQVAIGTMAGGHRLGRNQQKPNAEGLLREDATRYLRQSVESLKQAIKLSPNHVLAMFHLAVEAEQVDQLQISERLLLAGLDVDPRDTPQKGDFSLFLFLIRRAYRSAETSFLKSSGSASGASEPTARLLILHQRIQKYASMKAVTAKRVLTQLAAMKSRSSRRRELLPLREELTSDQKVATAYLDSFRQTYPGLGEIVVDRSPTRRTKTRRPSRELSRVVRSGNRHKSTI